MGHKFGSEMSTLSNTYQIPICSSSRQFETVAIEVAACIPAQFLSHSQIQLFSIPNFFNLIWLSVLPNECAAVPHPNHISIIP